LARERSIEGFRNAGEDQLDVEEYIKWSDIKYKERLVKMIIVLYSFLIVSTVTIIFFEGFGVGGFDLPDKFLNWLGGATIGEIGSLLAIVYKSYF
jgi:hypothetical protein